MPKFTRYTLEDATPPVPEGWLFVEYGGNKVKIIDNSGNSMAPFSRALVSSGDSKTAELIAEGHLAVISEATVSLENYVEANIASEAPIELSIPNDQLLMLKNAMAARTLETPDVAPENITPAEMASPEQIAAKEEAVKKTRKKKTADDEAASVNSSISEISQETQSDSTDTATPDESSSV